MILPILFFHKIVLALQGLLYFSKNFKIIYFWSVKNAMCIFLKDCFKSVDSVQNISSGIRNKTRVLTLTIFIQHGIGKPSHGNQTGRRNKRNPNWKGRIQLSLFAYDMILYIKNHRDTTKKLLKLINESSKVAWYKITIQKSVTFLHTNNELSERKIKETVHL